MQCYWNRYYYEYVTEHIERYQLSEDWILSYGDAKSKYLKYGLKVDYLQYYLIFKLLEGFGAKTMFSCKMNLWIAKIPWLCTNSQILRAPFSQNQLFTNLLWYPLWNCHISRTQCQMFAPTLSRKNSHLGNNKKSILTFWDNWSLSMYWVTYNIKSIIYNKSLWPEAQNYMTIVLYILVKAVF